MLLFPLLIGLGSLHFDQIISTVYSIIFLFLFSLLSSAANSVTFLNMTFKSLRTVGVIYNFPKSKLEDGQRKSKNLYLRTPICV